MIVPLYRNQIGQAGNLGELAQQQPYHGDEDVYWLAADSVQLVDADATVPETPSRETLPCVWLVGLAVKINSPGTWNLYPLFSENNN